MSLLDAFKSFTKGPEVSGSWKRPESEEDLRAIFESGSGVHIIYKHSFACSVCTFSLNSMERSMDDILGVGTPHFIDVRAQRPLSNLIAELSGVKHESPQVIIIRDGEAFWTGSHSEVRGDAVVEALNEL